MAIKVPFRLLNIEGDGYHLQISIRINGKLANAIIDTGASKTVFDRTRVVAFLREEIIAEHERMSTGLGTASMESHTVTLKKLAIGKIVIHEYQGVVLDLSHVNSTYKMIGLQPIDVVLGSDLMEKHKAVIDYSKRTLTLKPGPAKKKKSQGKKKAGKKVVKKTKRVTRKKW
jgi:hypothetical protein